MFFMQQQILHQEYFESGNFTIEFLFFQIDYQFLVKQMKYIWF